MATDGSIKLTMFDDPLPFPTLPITAPPRSQQPWIQLHWVVPIVVVHIVCFALFVGLLAVYLCLVRSPGKSVTADYVDDLGYSESDEPADKRNQPRKNAVRGSTRSVAEGNSSTNGRRTYSRRPGTRR